MVRISKSPAERRQEILAVAKELFFSKGYQGTSVADIVANVGVAQGLFYYYFKSKDEIFKAVLEQDADNIVETLGEIMTDDTVPFESRIMSVIDTFVELQSHSEHLLMDELHLAEHLELHDRVARYTAEMLAPLVAEILTDENSKGRLKVADPELAARFIIYGGLGLLSDHDNLKDRLKATTTYLQTAIGRLLGVVVEAKTN